MKEGALTGENRHYPGADAVPVESERGARAFSVPIASERGSISLFGRIFATQTGAHLLENALVICPVLFSRRLPEKAPA
jgi:hypothetical protein